MISIHSQLTCVQSSSQRYNMPRYLFACVCLAVLAVACVNGGPSKANQKDEEASAVAPTKGPGVVLIPATIVQAKDMPLIIVPNGQPVYVMPTNGRVEDGVQQPVLLGAGDYIYGGAPGFGGILFGRK